jgi:hypothetical protein
LFCDRESMPGKFRYSSPFERPSRVEHAPIVYRMFYFALFLFLGVRPRNNGQVTRANRESNPLDSVSEGRACCEIGDGN